MIVYVDEMNHHYNLNIAAALDMDTTAFLADKLVLGDLFEKEGEDTDSDDEDLGADTDDQDLGETQKDIFEYF